MKEMNEKNYKKRLDFQNQMISRQSQQIDVLKLKIERLEEKLKEKDKILSSIEPMRQEMKENLKEIKQKKKEYHTLINELKQMKEILNQEVYRGRWKIVRWLIKK